MPRCMYCNAVIVWLNYCSVCHRTQTLERDDDEEQ